MPTNPYLHGWLLEKVLMKLFHASPEKRENEQKCIKGQTEMDKEGM